MLKLIMCVKRLPELTREEFDQHWIERHAPLVRAHAQALGIKRYVQTVRHPNSEIQTAIQIGRGMLPVDFDGCAEVWWDNLEALEARKSPEGQKALRLVIEDERRFVDLSRSMAWFGIEREIIP
jgi:uncharacterized protein (TIGR02118 family)